MTNAATFERKNPLTGEVATSAPAFTTAMANNVADKAKVAFASWSELGPNARRAVLTKAATELEARASDFVEAMRAEIGATEGQAGIAEFTDLRWITIETQPGHYPI